MLNVAGILCTGIKIKRAETGYLNDLRNPPGKYVLFNHLLFIISGEGSQVKYCLFRARLRILEESLEASLGNGFHIVINIENLHSV